MAPGHTQEACPIKRPGRRARIASVRRSEGGHIAQAAASKNSGDNDDAISMTLLPGYDRISVRLTSACNAKLPEAYLRAADYRRKPGWSKVMLTLSCPP